MNFTTSSDPAARDAITAYTAHFSRELLNGLQTEIRKIDLPGSKSQREAIGLLLGTTDATCVRLEQFELVAIGDFGAVSFLERERLHGVLEKSISDAGLRWPQGPAVVGWYVLRPAGPAGLLNRDVNIHNKHFGNHRDIAMIMTLDAKKQPVVELYTAKPNTLLLTHNHQRALLDTGKVNVPAEGVDISLADSANNELFFDVYKAAQSLDRAEEGGRRGKMRAYAARLAASVGLSRTKAGPDEEYITPIDRLHSRDIPTPSWPAQPLPASARTPARDIDPVAEGDPAHRTAARKKSVAPELAPGAPILPRAEEHRFPVAHQGTPELQMRLPQVPGATSTGSPGKMGVLRMAAWFAATIVVSILTYIAAHLYLKPVLVRLAGEALGTPVANAHEPASPQGALALRVGQNGTALELQWDPLVPAIESAVSASLVINDGVVTRRIELDRTQLRSGRIVYTPVFGDVTFRLEVRDSISHSVAESIRVLGNSLADIPPEEGRQREDGITGSGRRFSNWSRVPDATSRILRPDSRERQSRVSSSPVAEPENQPAISPNKAPLLSSTTEAHPPSPVSEVNGTQGAPGHNAPTQNREQASHERVIPAPSLQDLAVAPNPASYPQITASLANERIPGPPPPTNNPQQAPKPASSIAVQPKPVSPAVVLSRSYPFLRPGVLFHDTLVSITVQISKEGRVTSAALVHSDSSVPPEVLTQALAAARKWRFSPAKVGDKAVSSESTVNFLFKPAGRP